MRNIRETVAGVEITALPIRKVGFHGATPAAQRAGAAQAAVPTAVIANAAGATPTQAEHNAVVAQVNLLTVLVNEMRAALVEKGLIKGAA